MCEALAAQQILDEGYKLEPSSLCQVCKERYGIERYGIHVEIDTLLFLLLGHLDRRLVLDNNRKLPVEIKSLGRFTWQNFAKYKFDKFIGYAGQEACYLEAEKSPGIYWVMNRDTGKSLKYIINDFNNEINLPGFEKIILPVTYESIMENLNMVEISILDGILPDAAYDENSDQCRYCRFPYLCVKTKPEEKVKEESLPTLVEAAQLHKEGKTLQKQAEERLDSAKETFLAHSKNNQMDKFRVGGISFTFSGEKTKSYIDEKLLRDLVDNTIMEQVIKHSKPYDSYTIRILKEDK